MRVFGIEKSLKSLENFFFSVTWILMNWT
jgi:hypothetical protein